jgi:signal transduction histidine kinase
MHRVRSVEENWTSGTGLGFEIARQLIATVGQAVAKASATKPATVTGEVVLFVEQTARPMRIHIGDGWIDRVQ